jgi:hypothetical protein
MCYARLERQLETLVPVMHRASGRKPQNHVVVSAAVLVQGTSNVVLFITAEGELTQGGPATERITFDPTRELQWFCSPSEGSGVSARKRPEQ